MNMSALENGSGINDLEQPSGTKEQYTCSASGVETIDELGNIFHDTLQVKEEKIGKDLSSDEDATSGLEDESTGHFEDCGTGNSASSSDDGSSGLDDENTNLDSLVETSSKCLQKCATFPATLGAEKTSDIQSENNPYTRSLSLPTAGNLVSAMKGSREKEGMPPKKLSVSWAPDVYDPPPTSLSHYPKKKVQQQYTKSNKKHGKGKQKGKTMRGGGSGPKDKKHYRKIGGKSDRCINSYSDTDRVMSSNNYKSSLDLLDFNDVDDDIGSPESNCGSSFRGKARSTMHFAYAEAS